MLKRTSSTILKQIFYEIMFNFQVIVKSIIDPDDKFKRGSFTYMG